MASLTLTHSHLHARSLARREKIPLIAPDVLRQLVKGFCDEVSCELSSACARAFPTVLFQHANERQDDTVKQQILNLAYKLFLSNPKQTSNLFKVLQLHLFSRPPGFGFGFGLPLRPACALRCALSHCCGVLSARSLARRST